MSCIPNIIEKKDFEVQDNINNINNYLLSQKNNKYSLEQLINEYPIIITDACKDLEKLKFYLKLYADISVQEFDNLINQNPLVLISKVKAYLILE